MLPSRPSAWADASAPAAAELLASSDVVSLHVPLTDGTRHMIDARAHSRTMRRGAILINAARGGVVDEAALVPALRSGTSAAPRSTSSSASRWTRPAARCLRACRT
jgi:phosphoglycerate dehydrogenase-like enzyme